MAGTGPFSIGFPVAFHSGGDTTKDAFKKHINEITDIYSHLNQLNSDKVNSQAVDDAITAHRNDATPHPNLVIPAMPTLETIAGKLDSSKITGNFGTDRISGLESYVKGLIPDKGDGITECEIKETGYVKNNNGLIIQWGRSKDYEQTGWNGKGTVYFDKEFPTACFTVVANAYYGEISDYADGFFLISFLYMLEKTKTSFNFHFWGAGFREQPYKGSWEGKMHVEYIATGY